MVAQAEALKAMGVSDDLRSFVHTDVESRMTAFLSKEEVLKPNSWSRDQVVTLASEICAADDQGNPLVADVALTAKLTRDLLQKTWGPRRVP